MKVLNESLLTAGEMEKIALKARNLSKQEKMDLYDTVSHVVDEMIKNKQHEGVHKGTRQFTVRHVMQIARKQNRMNEAFDPSLSSNQMKDILRHAHKMVKMGHNDTLEDAIMQQLEDIPGLENEDLDKIVKKIKSLA